MTMKKSSIFLATYLLKDMIFFSRIRLVKENPKYIYFFLPFSKNTCHPAKISPKEKEKNTLGESHKQAIFQYYNLGSDGLLIEVL
jgi:hypothetical protein